MYHTPSSKRSSSSNSSYVSYDSWGTAWTAVTSDCGLAAHSAPPFHSSSYVPSSSTSSSVGGPYSSTRSPQGFERTLSPGPIPLSPPHGYINWSASSSSSSSYGDGVRQPHGTGAGPTHPLLNPLLVCGNCSVSFDLGAPPRLHHSVANQQAFPVFDGPMRILFRDHPTWKIELSTRVSNGERLTIAGFLQYLYGFIHAEMEQDQFSVAAKTDDSHEAGRLPRMASPQPSFGMTPRPEPRVVDRRTGAGYPRGLRRYDYMGSKRVFAGLIPPQHPQDGSAWYVVLADASVMDRTPTHPYMRS